MSLIVSLLEWSLGKLCWNGYGLVCEASFISETPVSKECPIIPAMTLRNPRYTGANRCWPCTVVNVLIVAGIAGIAVIAGFRLVAGIVVVVGLAAIVLRGYVIPGTPQFTQYLPDPVLALFGKRQPEMTVPDDIVAALEATEVLAETTGDIELVESFRTTYEERASELVDDSDALAATIKQQFDDVTEIVTVRGMAGNERWLAQNDNETTLIQWEDRQIVAMDAAGAELLADRIDWHQRDLHEQQAALATLRRGARTCPDCRSDLEMDDGPDTVCCGGRSLTGALRCPSCEYPVVDTNDLPGAGGHRSRRGVN